VPRLRPLVDPAPAEIARLVTSTLSRNVSRPAPSQLLALWLYLPLRVNTPQGPIDLRSSLEASLRDCRDATNRDANGNVPPGADAGSWLGAIGYLALLDQIGGAVINLHPSCKPSGGSCVERALAHFTDVTGDEAICLYALRNSLAHDFSLVNVPPSTVRPLRRRKLTRLFTLTRGAPELIQWPSADWNPKRPNRGDATIVDVQLLGDLVEGAVREVRRVYGLGALRVRSDVTPAVWRAGRFFRHAV
jgi:hypothetical protein